MPTPSIQSAVDLIAALSDDQRDALEAWANMSGNSCFSFTRGQAVAAAAAWKALDDDTRAAHDALLAALPDELREGMAELPEVEIDEDYSLDVLDMLVSEDFPSVGYLTAYELRDALKAVAPDR